MFEKLFGKKESVIKRNCYPKEFIETKDETKIKEIIKELKEQKDRGLAFQYQGFIYFICNSEGNCLYRFPIDEKLYEDDKPYFQQCTNSSVFIENEKIVRIFVDSGRLFTYCHTSEQYALGGDVIYKLIEIDI